MRCLDVSAGKNEEDNSVAKDLKQQVERTSGPCMGIAGLPYQIWLWRRSDLAHTKELLTLDHLNFDPAMHDEGYIIVPDGQGSAIRAGGNRRNLRRHLLRRADGEAVDSRQR